MEAADSLELALYFPTRRVLWLLGLDWQIQTGGLNSYLQFNPLTVVSRLAWIAKSKPLSMKFSIRGIRIRCSATKLLET